MDIRKYYDLTSITVSYGKRAIKYSQKGWFASYWYEDINVFRVPIDVDKWWKVLFKYHFNEQLCMVKPQAIIEESK